MKKLLSSIVLALMSLNTQAANLTLAWDASSGADSYEIVMSANGTLTTNKTTGELQTIFAAPDNTPLSFWAYAISGDVYSDRSAVLSHFAGTPPAAPLINYAKWMRGSQWSLEIRWNAVSNATSYIVFTDIATNSVYVPHRTNFVTGTSLTYTFSNWAPQYRATVVSSNQYGLSPRSSFTQSPSVPVAPVLRITSQ